MTAELSREARKRLRWIDHYLKHGNASLTSRYFGISRTTLNKWPRAKVEIQKGREGILGRMLWNVFWVIPIDREATHMEEEWSAEAPRDKKGMMMIANMTNMVVDRLGRQEISFGRFCRMAESEDNEFIRDRVLELLPEGWTKVEEEKARDGRL